MEILKNSLKTNVSQIFLDNLACVLMPYSYQVMSWAFLMPLFIIVRTSEIYSYHFILSQLNGSKLDNFQDIFLC